MSLDCSDIRCIGCGAPKVPAVMFAPEDHVPIRVVGCLTPKYEHLITELDAKYAELAAMRDEVAQLNSLNADLTMELHSILDRREQDRIPETEMQHLLRRVNKQFELEIQANRNELAAMQSEQERGWTLKNLRQYVDDTSDGFECLPKCDSNGHEAMCPVTNVVAAFRLLREELAAMREQLTRIQSVAETGVIRGAAFALGEIQRICEEGK